MKLQRWLEAHWYSDRVPWLLRPFSALYRALLALRAGLYRSGLRKTWHPGIPVIVVGNLTVGGTGKTPLVLWLAQQLGARGWRTGIISRGHGGTHASAGGDARLVTLGDTPAVVGDEALLLAREAGCPVAVGVKRVDAALLLAAMDCQVLLADDGLQHLALRRDVEIAVVDAERLLGNGALLPAGPLREPPARLGSVDAVVYQGSPHVQLLVSGPSFRMQLQPQQIVPLAGGEPTPLQSWRGREVHAVAGIGNPARFFASLRALGIRPVEHIFPDHHGFEPADLAFADALDIVMTAKDAVKCATFATARMWYLRATVQFDGDEAAQLLQWLDTRLAGKR